MRRAHGRCVLSWRPLTEVTRPAFGYIAPLGSRPSDTLNRWATSLAAGSMSFTWSSCFNLAVGPGAARLGLGRGGHPSFPDRDGARAPAPPPPQLLRLAGSRRHARPRFVWRPPSSVGGGTPRL